MLIYLSTLKYPIETKESYSLREKTGQGLQYYLSKRSSGKAIQYSSTPIQLLIYSQGGMTNIKTIFMVKKSKAGLEYSNIGLLYQNSAWKGNIVSLDLFSLLKNSFLSFQSGILELIGI